MQEEVILCEICNAKAEYVVNRGNISQPRSNEIVHTKICLCRRCATRADILRKIYERKNRKN